MRVWYCEEKGMDTKRGEGTYINQAKGGHLLCYQRVCRVVHPLQPNVDILEYPCSITPSDGP